MASDGFRLISAFSCIWRLHYNLRANLSPICNHVKRNFKLDIFFNLYFIVCFGFTNWLEGNPELQNQNCFPLGYVFGQFHASVSYDRYCVINDLTRGHLGFLKL